MVVHAQMYKILPSAKIKQLPNIFRSKKLKPIVFDNLRNRTMIRRKENSTDDSLRRAYLPNRRWPISTIATPIVTSVIAVSLQLVCGRSASIQTNHQDYIRRRASGDVAYRTNIIATVWGKAPSQGVMNSIDAERSATSRVRHYQHQHHDYYKKMVCCHEGSGTAHGSLWSWGF